MSVLVFVLAVGMAGCLGEDDSAPSDLSSVPESSTPPTPPPAAFVNTALRLFNIDFGGGTQTSKVGLADGGLSDGDFWNFFSNNGAVTPIGQGGQILSGVKYSDGLDSNVSVVLSIQPGVPNTLVIVGAGDNGAAGFDPMFASYIYPRGLFSASPDTDSSMRVDIHGLEAGTYDFLIYGHGPENQAVSRYELFIGQGSVGAKTSSGDGVWRNPSWSEGAQDVVFRSMKIQGSETASIHISKDPGFFGSFALIAGLQIVQRE